MVTFISGYWCSIFVVL